jgi:hypothetical protein
MKKLQALQQSCFNSLSNSSYHGSKLKVVLNLDRNIKKNFIYYEMCEDWVEIPKERAIEILK